MISVGIRPTELGQSQKIAMTLRSQCTLEGGFQIGSSHGQKKLLLAANWSIVSICMVRILEVQVLEGSIRKSRAYFDNASEWNEVSVC